MSQFTKDVRVDSTQQLKQIVQQTVTGEDVESELNEAEATIQAQQAKFPTQDRFKLMSVSFLLLIVLFFISLTNKIFIWTTNLLFKDLNLSLRTNVGIDKFLPYLNVLIWGMRELHWYILVGCWPVYP